MSRVKDGGYDSVHRRCAKAFGSAVEHSCVSCGAPAAEWAYQYSAEEELYTSSGCPYSEELADYAPMCVKCHRRFDLENDLVVQELVQEGRRAGARALRNRFLDDPDFEASWRASMAEAGPRIGAVARSLRYICEGCGLVSSPSGIHSHQKSTQHEGIL